MKEVHIVVGVLAIVVNAIAGGYGAWRWWRVEQSRLFWRLLRVGQAIVVVQIALGGILVLIGYKPPGLHVIYGVLPLLVSFIAEQLRVASAQMVLDSSRIQDGRGGREAAGRAAAGNRRGDHPAGARGDGAGRAGGRRAAGPRCNDRPLDATKQPAPWRTLQMRRSGPPTGERCGSGSTPRNWIRRVRRRGRFWPIGQGRSIAASLNAHVIVRVPYSPNVWSERIVEVI